MMQLRETANARSPNNIMQLMTLRAAVDGER